jgi:hypothetical protein
MFVTVAAFAAAAAIGVPASSAKQSPKTASTPALIASQACAISQGAAVFAAWGDLNSYSPFPDASFEASGAGWSFGTGASVVVGDDDHLLTQAGTHALQLAGGATVTSPFVCTDSTTPSMRFFIRRIAGSGKLTISGSAGTGKGAIGVTLASMTGTTSWAPSAPVTFPTQIAALIGSGSLSARFTFTAERGTTFRIDDVQMDPYRRT